MKGDRCECLLKAICEAEAEEMRAKKAAQKAAFNAQVSENWKRRET